MREIRQAPIERKILEESWEKVAQVAKRGGKGFRPSIPAFSFLGLGEDLLRPSFVREINATHCYHGFRSTWILDGGKVEFHFG